MEIKILSAGNPRFANKEKTAINLDVHFEHMKEYGKTPFTAVKGSPDHSGDLFIRAMKNEFGKITEYIDDTLDFRVAVSTDKVNKLISESTMKISVIENKIEYRGETPELLERKKALVLFRMDIDDLMESPNWPDVVFPEIPQ